MLKAIYTNHFKIFTNKLDELLISYNLEMDVIFEQQYNSKILWEVEIYEVKNTPDKIYLYLLIDGELVKVSNLKVVDIDTNEIKYSLSNIKTQVVLLESIEDCIKMIKSDER